MFPDGVGLHEQPGPAPDDLEEESVGVGGEVVSPRLHEEAVRDAALKLVLQKVASVENGAWLPK